MDRSDRMRISGAELEIDVSSLVQSHFRDTCKIINNLEFYNNRVGRNIECDVLVITNKCIYCIECKNYNGYIKGEELDLKWSFASSGNLSIVNNPVLNNNKHIRTIKGLMYSKGLGEINMKSFVVVPNRCNIHTECEEVIHLGDLIDRIDKNERKYKDTLNIENTFKLLMWLSEI